MSHKITAAIGDKHITIETGKLAKQADGAVTVQMGETIVIVAAVAATKAKEGQDFFPLTVDYREKAAAAGKFPGGYFKREGRPTEKEILTCRLTDRPIRPLFPKGLYNEVQVQTILLSADGENEPDILSIIGASASLMVSDIPWAGPLGAVRVGRVNGQFIANPTHAEQADSDLDLVYVGNDKDVVMFEGAAKEITEADFNAALKYAQEVIQPIIAAQKELAAKFGKKKREFALRIVPEEILHEAKALAGDRFVPALLTPGKLAREGACNAIKDEVGVKLQRDRFACAIQTFGKERANGAVGEAAGENFLLGRPAFALEIAAGKFSRRGRLFAVIHGEREKILAFLGFRRGHSGHDNDGFAQLDGYGAVGLLGQLAGFNGNLFVADGGGNFV